MTSKPLISFFSGLRLRSTSEISNSLLMSVVGLVGLSSAWYSFFVGTSSVVKLTSMLASLKLLQTFVLSSFFDVIVFSSTASSSSSSIISGLEQSFCSKGSIDFLA